MLASGMKRPPVRPGLSQGHVIQQPYQSLKSSSSDGPAWWGLELAWRAIFAVGLLVAASVLAYNAFADFGGEERRALCMRTAGGTDANSSTLPQSSALLSILTPVFPDATNLGFLRNQLRSFDRFFDASSIEEWVLVTPLGSVPALEDVLLPDLRQLKAAGSKIRIVADEECAPEMEVQSLKVRPRAMKETLVAQGLR